MTTNQPPTWHDPKEQPVLGKHYYVLFDRKGNIPGIAGPYKAESKIELEGFVLPIVGWLYDYELIPKLPTVEEAAIELADEMANMYDFINTYGFKSAASSKPDRILIEGETATKIIAQMNAYIQARERSGR